MEWWADTAVMVGMFLLRLGVPFAVTLAIAWALKRLNARWQREAELRLASLSQAIAAQCRYAGQTNPVCWVARRQAEGALAAECRSCTQFMLRKVA
ncbi:MAG: hypothetical protein NZ765_06610 [Anaerolineae bacterium]|nr:hypothetical protein [Anaerolineae bacterium]MDW8071242.1 hypothetical protein [Anaerolineae bacterium]